MMFIGVIQLFAEYQAVIMRKEVKQKLHFRTMVSFEWVENEDLRPKTQKYEDPSQNHL